MFSISKSTSSARGIRSLSGLALAAAAFSPTTALAQSFLGTTGGNQVVCTGSSGSIVIRDNDCGAGGTGLVFPTGFQVGNATFNDPDVGAESTTFIGGTVLINAPLTVTAPTAMNGTTTFGFTATFNGLADFNSGITSDTITNSGTINTATLSAGTIIGSDVTASGALRASPATTVDMGSNRIQFVADGIADTDAATVGQLNAATSGITTDVTALETVTATHTTQIADIQTVNTTQATQITSIQAVNTTQATQISALQASDTGFDTRIDTLELLSAELDDRIGKVDDRASAGTAAAVALSGAMFLPGKTFNLTGNVGTYRGAHAAALQFGALVNDNVALNAGVAHGFNKGGKTALRAGFTIGW
jgi:autotransporter adhesin